MSSDKTQPAWSGPDGAVEEVRRVLACEAKALDDCARRLSQPEAAEPIRQALERMGAALARNGKIIVTGVGKSGKVAQKIVATFCSTGSLAVFLHPTEGLHGDLGLVRPEDIVLALSYTGNTEELVRLLPSLRARGRIRGLHRRPPAVQARRPERRLDRRLRGAGSLPA